MLNEIQLWMRVQMAPHCDEIFLNLLSALKGL